MNSHKEFAVETLLIVSAIWAVALFIYGRLENSSPVFFVAALGTAVTLMCVLVPEWMRRVGNMCFRYRWVLALLVFLFCLLLRLHGSSIGIYDEVFPSQIVSGENTLFGMPRWIRSDEYGVQTPAIFSQYYNHYRLKSFQLSLSGANMVLDGYGPVLFPTAVGIPLMWGFLLFGNELGLSWYWCGEIILLFMTALEMCLILTGGCRRESLLGAVMIALSPAVQWWVMPIMPVVILYTMSLFCTGYWFFTAVSSAGKWVSALLLLVASVGFCISLFPSFQVPCGYTALLLLAVCLRRDRGNLTFKKRDWPRLTLTLLTSVGILVYFVLVSREDIALMMHTVYPGNRVSLGGLSWCSTIAPFPDPVSLILPYSNVNFTNNCEAASYIHFAPFFLVLFPQMFVRLKKHRDPALAVGTALAAVLLIELEFMLFGFPRFLADITLFRYCNRMHEVYGWAAVLFTVWGFSVLRRYPGMLLRWEKLLLPLVFGAAILLLTDGRRRTWFAGLSFRGLPVGWLLFALALADFVLILLLVVFQKKRLYTALIVITMCFAGGTVNPVERGIGAVTNHPVSAVITEIASREPESRWLSVGDPFYLGNFAMANGARVLNATIFYPDPEKWTVVDPEGKYSEATNRYANQRVTLTDDATSVEVIQGDYIQINLNPKTLRQLEISYLFSSTDDSELLSRHGIDCEYISGQDGYGIYRLQYR